MTHTDRTTVLASAIKNLINTNKVALGLDLVLYGDHVNIPKGKVAIVNSLTKTRTITGVGGPGGRATNILRVGINVYFSVYGPEEAQRLAVDQLAEEIENLIHQDTEVNDLVIHGYVTRWDPGLVFKPGTMFRAVSMEFEAQTKTQLTTIPGP